jgi:ABC-type bacteriocin/lantibiotic exporter with double-glycine peptidase domain
MIFVVVLIVLMVLFIWPNARKSAETAIAESVCKFRVVAWFEEVATYPFMFKGRGGYDMAYGRTNELATDYLNARRAHFRLVMRQIVGLLLVSVLASVALLVIGVLLVLRQELTLGQLVASEIIMGSIVASIIKLGKKLETWYDTLAATDKVGHLLDLETESEEGETVPIENQAAGIRIEAKGVSFAYQGNDPLFENLSFKLEPSMRACICGAQGSGVSSLLDLCFALRETTAGYMSFDGLDMRAWDLEVLRSSMELLRADEFVSGTVIENLRLGRSEITLDDIHNALKTVGLLDTCLRHPSGLEMPIQIGGAPFPPYQRAALLVARALVQKPRLLLIDEIFDGLDEQSLRRLTEIVFDRERPWTVVVASRMPEVREMCELWIRL